jgi:hypothetical protein
MNKVDGIYKKERLSTILLDEMSFIVCKSIVSRSKSLIERP